MAQRRLPKSVFDFIEGGLEDERELELNTSGFHSITQFLPTVSYLTSLGRC
jgi:isopentenyl diphosphate isomerase/L-lactate dehydrogenase-like FMN-dependent dehydrogenase